MRRLLRSIWKAKTHKPRPDFQKWCGEMGYRHTKRHKKFYKAFLNRLYGQFGIKT